MKKSILLVCSMVLAIGFTSCEEKAVDKVKAENVEAAAERDANANRFPVMKFEEKVFDFGHIQKNEKQTHTFKFTNTGDVPLIVSKVKSSCGCTIPEKPTEAIQPGKEGEIKVTYNGSGKGQVSKTITINANTEKGVERVSIKAFVEVPEAATTAVK
ncbi:hypothetical protein NBRC110019_27480 [Neptunitalea chrysea]|uniref:DUF1573 domain-containing protein n=1 Tax=Neptunitalea chrysea TaxID=1647581 RepID=A0A9W6EWC8_9FLAO|nr:DUF1573 domain-containing protein [Neptunitalea chrysea]GLB53707.1 hypothetical protein NBRC110019_27480 [Neptunitalea chrysea]